MEQQQDDKEYAFKSFADELAKQQLYGMASEMAKRFAASSNTITVHARHRPRFAMIARVVRKLTAAKVFTDKEIRSLSKTYFVDSLLMCNDVRYDIKLWRKILMNTSTRYTNTRYECKLYSSCIAMYYPYHLL